MSELFKMAFAIAHIVIIFGRTIANAQSCLIIRLSDFLSMHRSVHTYGTHRVLLMDDVPPAPRMSTSAAA